MALGYYETFVNWNSADAATTEYTVDNGGAGLGFEPKAAMCVIVGLQASNAHSGSVDQNYSIGFAADDGTRRSVASFSDDANASADDCGVMARNDAVLHMVDGTGALTAALDIAFDADAVRLIVDDAAPVNVSVLIKIWGGTDIDAVAIGDVAEPAATGNQDTTATGMVSGANADQVLFLAGVQSTAAVNSGAATDAGMYFGMAHDSGQFVCCINSDDGSASSDTDHYGLSGECVAQIVNGGGNPNARASFTQWNTDGFRLNWAARATTNRRSIFMAIKGGQWAIGEFTIDASTASSTATVSGLAFAPQGILLATCSGAEEAAGTSATLAAVSIGGGTSTSNRHALFLREDNGAATTAIWTGVRDDCAVGMQNNGTGSRERFDINAMNSDGFQMITDQANASDVTNWWVGYAAFADAAVTDVDIAMDAGALVLAALQATRALDVTEAAALATLTLAPQSATIGFAASITSTLALLALSPQQAAVALDTAIAAELEALTLATLPAGIALDAAIGAALGTLTLAPQAATITAEVGIPAQLATLVLAAQQASAGLETVVSAQLGTLALSAQAAQVALEATIPGALATLSLEGQAAAIALVQDIAAAAGVLVLVSQQASISTALEVAAEAEALTLAAQSAAVVLDAQVLAAAGALVLAAQASQIYLDVAVGAVAAALSLSPLAATVLIDLAVAAQAGTLTLAQQQAVITYDVALAAGLGALALTSNPAQVALAADIAAALGSLTLEALVAVVEGATVIVDLPDGQELVLQARAPYLLVRPRDPALRVAGGAAYLSLPERTDRELRLPRLPDAPRPGKG